MNQQKKFSYRGKCLALASVALLGSLMFGAAVQAAAPPAGSTIGNQASASYTDASATPRTATSNSVVTTVLPVYSLSLTTSQNVPGAPGATLYFPHTLTNNGNATDTFNLTPANVALSTNVPFWGASPGGDTNFQFTLANIKIYVDANGDGNPDNFTPVTSSGAIAAGSSYKFVLAVPVPASRVSNDIAAATITATSTNDGTKTLANQDSIKVSGNAVMVVTKGISVSSGPPGTSPVTYTITYTNTGNSTATAFAITDVIQAGLTYTLGSGKWSVTGAAALSDPSDGAEVANAGIQYQSVGGTITATIASVAPNASGTLSYTVSVNALPLAPQVIPNTATISYNDGSVVQTGSTNNAPFTVLQVGSVVANGSSTDNSEGAGENVIVASALQGSTVTFSDYIWNNGNGSDTFNLSYPLAGVGANTFPPGTTFQLFKNDGVTPLTDTGSDSILDTGIIPRPSAGACPSGFVYDAVHIACGYKVVVKATLPISEHNGGVYDMPLTATSIFDNTKSNQVINELTTITNSAVDLSNAGAECPAATTPPDGTTCGSANVLVKAYNGPVEGGVVSTITVNPGQSAVFTHVVRNAQGLADSYDLKASTDNTFAAFTLPTGWAATFKLPNDLGSCIESAGHPLGTTITNTGLINPSATLKVCAVIAVPANQTAIPTPGQNIFFRVKSPTTGASDIKWDAIIVDTLRSITLTPNQSGQVFPGGTVTYPHILCNTGNVTEPTINLASVDSLNSPTPTGWSSVTYNDANGNGVIDGGEVIISTTSLNANTCKNLVVKVFAPSGANLSDINQTVITASTPVALINGKAAPANATAVDTTQVIAGQVRLTKKQAYDATCNGTCGGSCSASYVTTTISAKPGECVRYEITAVNEGSANVTGLILNDNTPASTTYYGTSVPVACAVTTPAGACNSTSAPSTGSTGTVTADVGTLVPSQKGILTFGVKIDQ